MTSVSLPGSEDPLGPGEFWRCLHCDTVFGAADEPTEDDLTCRECGEHGFVRQDSRARQPMRERWGAVSARDFAALPGALYRHRALLGLTADHLVLVAALELHRHRPDDAVWPSAPRLSALAGLSEK